MILIIFLTICFSTSLFASNWLPYYSFNFSEGVYIPSVGKWGWTTILSNDIGFIVKPDKQHRGFLYYQLKYEGPGLKRQEAEQFQQRSMGHTLVLQHNYIFKKSLLLKTRINYGYEYWRSGTNELWGLGLYDNEVLGLMEELEFIFKDNIKFKTKVGFNYIKFPNYTDLIEEYITGAEEITLGKQDNNMYLFSFELNYKFHRIVLDTYFQDYIRQKVLEQLVGSFSYSKDKQKDLSINLGYYPNIKLLNFLLLTPEIILKYKDSNQGFLYLQSYDITTSTPVVIYDYYDYIRFKISLPFNFDISKTKNFSFIPEIEITSYLNRPPRDQNNNLIEEEKQKNQLFVISFIYTTQSENQQRKVSLFYTYQQQISNMKFERYYPYNYFGHYFGLKFSYSY